MSGRERARVTVGERRRAASLSRADPSFDDNACVLLNNKGEMLGTRINGVVSAELSNEPNNRWAKILGLATKVSCTGGGADGRLCNALHVWHPLSGWNGEEWSCENQTQSVTRAAVGEIAAARTSERLEGPRLSNFSSLHRSSVL